MRSTLSRLLPAALCLMLAMPALAQDAVKTDAAADAVKKLLETKFPGASISNVSMSPYFGLYEAQFDERMVYTDAKVTYVLVGAIYDANTKQNLSDARMRKLNRIAFDALPLDIAIKKVKGNGSRKLAIFEDPDCPFCKRIESEMKEVTDLTLYIFLFPIDQLHPDATRKSKLIWCSADRVKAWDDYFDSGKLPDNKGDCATPVTQTAELAKKYRVNATPTLVFVDGSVIPGAIPRERLEAELTQADAEAKKLAATKK